MAPVLPSKNQPLTLGEFLRSGGDIPKPASPAHRLTLDDLADPQAARRPNAPTDDDFNVAVIASEAATAADTISTLVRLYHRALVASVELSGRLDQAESEARRRYPEPPPEIQAQGVRAYRSVIYAPHDWPKSLLKILYSWQRQCRRIDDGLDLPAAREALETAHALSGDLMHRVLQAPTRSVKDAAEKLGAFSWLIKHDVLDEDERSTILRQLKIDLDSLAAQETQLA